MRNNFLFVALLVASVVAFVGCKPKNDVNVEDLANSMNPAAFEKTPSHSKTVVDGLTFSVVEYTITDAAKKQITRSAFSVGDGVEEEPAPLIFTYAKGDLCESGLGFHYTFTDAQGVVTPLVFWGNALQFENDVFPDGSAPIKNVKSVIENFPNNKWLCMADAYYIDTTIHHINRKDTIKHVEVIGGKKQWVIDSVMITVKDSAAYDTIGLKTVKHTTYAFNRGADKKNVGSKLEEYGWYDRTKREGLKDTVTLVRDSAATFEFRWGLNRVTSASRFALTAQGVSKDTTMSLSISAFDMKKKSTKVGNDTYRLVETEE